MNLSTYPDAAVVRVARGLTQPEKTFLLTLASHQEVMKTSVQRTCEDMAMSRATFYRVRSALLAKGLITETLRSRTTTEYRLVRPAVEALVPSHSETERVSHCETGVSERDAGVSEGDSAVSQRDGGVSESAPERELEDQPEVELVKTNLPPALGGMEGVDFIDFSATTVDLALTPRPAFTNAKAAARCANRGCRAEIAKGAGERRQDALGKWDTYCWPACPEQVAKAAVAAPVQGVPLANVADLTAMRNKVRGYSA